MQSHESILSAAREYLGQMNSDPLGQTSIEVTAPDRRLRFKPCDRGLEAFLPPGGRHSGNVTVGVRCPAKNRWSLYLQAKVAIQGDVVVTRHPIGAGAVVVAGDVLLERRDLTRISSGYLQDTALVIGQVVKGSYPAGTVLAPGHLKRPVVVKKGEKVTIMALSGSITVRMQGEALADGVVGERIRVRNLSSQQVVEVVVEQTGVVRAPM